MTTVLIGPIVRKWAVKASLLLSGDCGWEAGPGQGFWTLHWQLLQIAGVGAGLQNGFPSSRWVRGPGSLFAEVPRPSGPAWVGPASSRNAERVRWPRRSKESVARPLATAGAARPSPLSQPRFSFSPVLQARFRRHGSKGPPESLCRL